MISTYIKVFSYKILEYFKAFRNVVQSRTAHLRKKRQSCGNAEHCVLKIRTQTLFALFDLIQAAEILVSCFSTIKRNIVFLTFNLYSSKHVLNHLPLLWRNQYWLAIRLR